MKTVFFRSLALLASTALVLTACDGDSGSTTASTPPAVTPPATDPTSTTDPVTPVATTPAVPDAEVLAYADITNISSSSYPWMGNYAGVVKRWNPLVPVKTNGEPRAVPAMDAIEAKLGFVVFDRTSIANLDDAAITRGLIFRQGTAYLPVGANPQAFCANVSGAPYSGSYPQPFMFAPGEISARLYVNLDNPQCTVSDPEVVIHELGHALGLGAHFKGFGDADGAIGPEFWAVLATLYGNPIGTPKVSVVVKQIAN